MFMFYIDILYYLTTDRRENGWSSEDALNMMEYTISLNTDMIESFHETSDNSIYELKFQLLDNFIEG